MKATRFEDWEIWQMAREIIRKIYDITGNTKFKTDYGLKD